MFDNSVEQEMCPIALASHLLGDKWIPIIIRDIALFDRRTFNDILKKEPGKNFVWFFDISLTAAFPFGDVRSNGRRHPFSEKNL